MSSKKKRNKQYKGSHSATVRPTVVKVEAVKRNHIHQWWIDHQQVARPVLTIGGIAAVILITVIGLIDFIW